MIRCTFAWLVTAAITAPALDLNVVPATTEPSGTALVKARDAVRASGKLGKEAITIHLAAGTYYLPDTLVFTPADSGSAAHPVTWVGDPAGGTIISGGARLNLSWKPHKNGIWQASTPAGMTFDQLFINGERQRMARYPNWTPDNTLAYNGFAKDAIERAAQAADPTGGYIHAMHTAEWGGYHYRITGKKPDGSLAFEGGWQNNRQMGMHKTQRMVENIFEELDAPQEWYHNQATQTLYFQPDGGKDPTGSVVEVVRLPQLIAFTGSAQEPVKGITLKNLTLRHTARTFMDNKEPLLRSDWTIFRSGAVIFTGTEDCALVDSHIDQPGANAVFVNTYNRRVTIQGCLIHDVGASAVAFVGDPGSVRNPLFEYNQKQKYDAIDKTPGPKTDNYPADCLVDDCLLHDVGVVEKQGAGVQISMAMGITVRHCTIYNTSRSGININEGTFGGHVIEFCDVFNTVQQTGDHGSFNSWGRDRFWNLQGVPAGKLPELARLDCVKTNIIRNSRWRCDHGWAIDLDDGSSNYDIANNLLLSGTKGRGGLKFREGFHRKAHNNIIINNSFHPHVWYPNSGDEFTSNIVMGPYQPAGMKSWDATIDRNLFTTEKDRVKFAKQGCDEHSLVGDPQFIDPLHGDFRVRDTSPAMKLGFVNFPMDQFGVQRPALKKLAKSPEILPPLGVAAAAITQVEAIGWLGAELRILQGEEFSAVGVPAQAPGAYLANVPTGSKAEKAGLATNDFITAVDGQPVADAQGLIRLLAAKPAGSAAVLTLRRNQKDAPFTLKAPYVVPSAK